MDTVYDSFFDAYLIVNPNTYAKKVNLGPWSNSLQDYIYENLDAKIEENDEIDLYFNSVDPDARLYLDALECCPLTNRIMADDSGLVYCTPSEEIIKLYRSDSNYDALRVDTLQISVSCKGNTYISYLQVVPKQMSLQEWEIMRDDLESEIRGLAQDIVRRNIGLGSDAQGVLPPDDLHAFLIINKNAQAIMSALLDIKDRPKYKLTKSYEEVDEFRNREIDTETVKRYLRRGAKNNKLLVPRRDIVYDIPENRLLKKIVKSYDEKLGRFISIIDATIGYRKQLATKKPKINVYDTKYIEGLETYLETAKKLKKVTNIIKSAEWFREVKQPEAVFIPHSFAVDSRYGTLYRLYTEMKNHDFSITLDPRYSYSWKKSSSLYEMWCYIAVCRSLLKEYSSTDSTFDNIFTRDQLFPFLESGTKITLENDHSIIELVFDSVLPKKSNDVQAFNNPLYITRITGRHNRPDICINIYSKTSGWYIGSFIIECKYRKLSSFWYGKTWSSKEQIIAYHNDSKSPLFFDGYLDSFTSTRPVHQVLVFTPDVFEQRSFPDDKVSLVTFKPKNNRVSINEVCNNLLNSIYEKIEQADEFYTRFTQIKSL